MAITYTWEVINLERSLSDGFVSKVIYSVVGVNDGTERAGTRNQVEFIKPSSLPSDFKSYESLSESVCLTWVKEALGSDEVTAIETTLANQINVLNTPVTGTGKPWS